MKCTLLCVALVFVLYAKAQETNLVINPGFEKYEVCPESTTDGMDHKLIQGWTYPTLTHPDYFNRCSKGIVKVPGNFAGNAEPHSGDGYMGAILSGSDLNYREYLQGEFTSPLEAGQRYCVTFYYRLASFSRFAVDQLSIYFVTDKLIDDKNKTFLSVEPQFNNLPGLFLDNHDRWNEMCFLYTAKGGEKHFIIGNFKNYENTNYVVTDKTVVNDRNKSYAYYYYDDFSVRLLSDCGVCSCVKHDLQTMVLDTFYTGGVDPITKEFKKVTNDGRIKITSSGGTQPYKIEWNNGANEFVLNNLSFGEYSYTVTDVNNCSNKGSIKFNKPIVQPDPFAEDLQNLEEGSVIVLKNIFFETGKATLLPQSYVELNKVADFIKTFEIDQIEISGHTDNEGADQGNQVLSENRAKSVVAYLVSQQIEPIHLLAIGYGESKPIDTNQTAEGRALNRRVEFKLLKK